MSQTNYFPTIVGLCIALGGTALPVNKLFGSPEGFAARVLEQGFLWMLFCVVIVIVIQWEKQPLSSIGFHWQWRSVAWGFLLTVVMILMTAPLGDWVLRQSGLQGLAVGLSSWPSCR